VVVIILQVITIWLIITEFVAGIQFAPTKRFDILIPRLISSFYMHSALTDEVRNSLLTMKYVVNHPDHFRRRAWDEDEHGDTKSDVGFKSRIFFAFFIGFVQYVVSITIELMSIIYLNSQTSYLFILICYATLATIANFDNMFAATMMEHSIKENVGKRLRTTYHRYMFFNKEGDNADANPDHQEDEVHENFHKQSM